MQKKKILQELVSALMTARSKVDNICVVSPQHGKEHFSFSSPLQKQKG